MSLNQVISKVSVLILIHQNSTEIPNNLSKIKTSIHILKGEDSKGIEE